MEGEGYQEVNKFRKKEKLGIVIFNICSQKFGFDPTESTKETLSVDEARNINYSKIHSLIDNYESLKPKRFKHHVYNRNYLLEKNQRKCL